MIRNYFKLAIRNLMKHKTFSFINIFGLSIGLTCCMMIALYIYHEYSYDQYHEKGNRIYQLGSIFNINGENNAGATVPAPMAGTMEREFPEIEGTARLLRLFQDDKTLLKYETSGVSKSFYETAGYIADASFFKTFSYDFIEGNPKTVLQEPNTVVVTKEIAEKLFGNQPALGKQIRISSSTNGDHDYTIIGVFKPNRKPSHLDARFIMSIQGGNLEDLITNSTNLLNNNMFYTYLLLKEGTEPTSLEAKFPAFVDKHMGEALKAEGSYRSFFLTPLKEIHLASHIAENVTPPGSKKYIYILGSIAILTLLIACINFMNLSTSRSSKRSVEVGVRKVLGAERKSLVWQFLGESLIMAFVAFLFAVIFVQLLLPLFEQVAGKEIILAHDQKIQLYALFLFLAIFTGLVAGSYPAFFLSSFKPVRVLKGKFSNSLAATSLRKGLVIFQFSISIILIIASVVISNQMDFLRSSALGFEKEQQVVIPLRSRVAKENYNNLKSQLTDNPGVKTVGASSYYPGIGHPRDWLMYKEGQSVKDSKTIYINEVDNSFLQTLEILPVAGRLFSKEFTSDNDRSMIVNEKGIAEFGFSSAEEAVGNWIAFDWEGEQFRFDIVGVVKNFHFKDLHIGIESYGFVLNNGSNHNYMVAQLSGGNIGNKINSIESIWNTLIPNEPFEYSFLDQDFQKNYLAENRLAKMIGYFTLIAILISCLGLFGLATFSAEQRIREIGLRKVLGASAYSLVTLLTNDFLKLVLIAVVIASPIAWYMMNKWLQTFAYRVDISWEVFALTTLLAVVIAIVTVSFQAIKTALVNPVKNLRTE